jgi:endonuclease/exonuclease/phosphatase family metal-dependent hydrolase
MRTVVALAVTVVTTLVTATLGGPPGASAAPPAQSSAAAKSGRAAANLRVATFNVRNVSLDGSGALATWAERRGTVIAQILGQAVDVIGVQEVNPSRKFAPRLVDGHNQYVDLRNGLNKAGGAYELTNRYAYNCKRPSTSWKCKPKNRRSSHSDRILYNTATLTLVKQGKLKYHSQVASHSPSHLGWAVLRSRVNGAEFLFTTTHLEPKVKKVKKAQWREMIKRIDKVRDGRPVVAVGDFNTTKYSPVAAKMLPRMRRHGYGDAVGQRYKQNPVRSPRARVMINGWINSLNRGSRDVRTFAYETDRSRTGDHVDWIFASKGLPVLEHAVVVDYDPATLMLNGVVPSDHNMLRATLALG